MLGPPDTVLISFLTQGIWKCSQKTDCVQNIFPPKVYFVFILTHHLSQIYETPLQCTFQFPCPLFQTFSCPYLPSKTAWNVHESIIIINIIFLSERPRFSFVLCDLMQNSNMIPHPLFSRVFSVQYYSFVHEEGRGKEVPKNICALAKAKRRI